MGLTDKAVMVKQIAERLGCEPSTVRKVVYGNWQGGSVATRTAKRIINVATSMGFPLDVLPEEIGLARPMMSGDEDDEDDAKLSHRLHDLLGDDGYLLLLEHYAGVRLYVPHTSGCSQLTDALTRQHAMRLCAAFAGEYIRVPLGREFIVLQYRKKGFSTRKIVRTLRITESGYNKLTRRLRERGELSAEDVT